VGALVPYLGLMLVGLDSSGSTLFILFFGVLALMRILPALLRRVIPFTDEAQSIWQARRQLAKRYDSYQWKKLTWIGIGWGVYAVIGSEPRKPLIILAIFCCFVGLAGTARWTYRKRIKSADGNDR
jgi:hypothetical protein